MKKFLLISMCVIGLVFAGTAANQAPAKKEPVKKEAPAVTKDVKKAKAKKVAAPAAVVAPVAAPAAAATSTAAGILAPNAS